MAALDQIVDALLPDWPTLLPEGRASVSAHCARFVRRQIALSPAHIRFGLRVLFAAFVVFSFLYMGMRCHANGAPRRCGLLPSNKCPRLLLWSACCAR